MKTTKKLVALLTAALLLMALLPTALATEPTTYSITITTAQSGHTYTAYQIFGGELSTNASNNKVLSNIEFGTGVSEAGKAALLAFTEPDSADAAALAGGINQGNVSSFAELAAEAANLGTGTSVDYDGAAGGCVISGLNPGYYLVIDAYTSAEGSKSDALSSYMVTVVGDATVASKHSYPTVVKKVYEGDYTGAEYGTGYNDVADYSIGDAVPFHLIGTIPEMGAYDNYYYCFHDTLSDGLTAPAGADVKVYLSTDAVLDDTDHNVTSEFTVTVSGQTITASIANLKRIVDAAKEIQFNATHVIVAYSATLNTSAVIGLDGNPNTVTLEYSNDPNHSGDGDTNPTGQTPEDKVIVFTYQLDVTKVDGQDTTKKLPGAKFVLLDGGADHVAQISGGKFDGWVTIPQPDPTTGKVTWPANCVLTSGTDGVFSVAGLEDGLYNLREIEAPAGYNLLQADVTFQIDARTENGQAWNGTASSALTALWVAVGETESNGNTSTGAVSVTVSNNQGSVLPATGGIGTTMFYVIGSVLVIGAVVLLVSKKRMNAIE